MTAQEDQMRILYWSATDTKGITQFYNASLNLDESSSLLKCYKGVATAMYAGVASSVMDKLSYFNRGKALIESAVSSDWNNAEIRFLRFSIQCEAPMLLGYSGRMEEDTKRILEALRNKEMDAATDFWRKAIVFMLDSGELSQELQNEISKYRK